MKIPCLIIFFILLCLSIILALPLQSEDESKSESDANDILARVDRIFDYPVGIIKGKMLHMKPDGRSRIISITVLISKDDYLFKFNSRKRGEELKILYNLGGEDIWVYCVSTNKLFNKKGIDKYNQILSTNYYYIDLSNADFKSNYNAEITGDAFVKGYDTFELKLYPILKGGDYGLLTIYVSKKDFIPLRIDYHDTNKVIFKSLTITKVITKNKKIIPIRYDMMDIRNGTLSILEFLDFDEDVNFDMKIFKYYNLGRE